MITWDKKLTVEIGEYNVPIPDPPPEQEMINYGKKLDEQIFRRDNYPRDIRHLPLPEQHAMMKELWRKRREGQWQIIKGEPLWIPGRYWFFLNFWTVKSGGLPDFRKYQYDIMLWWEMIVRDPNCHGGYLVKSRRVGGTELFLAEQYEYVTRVRDTHAGMQNLSADDARKDFKRILRAHRSMPWYLRPITASATDTAGTALEFKWPSKTATAKNIEETHKLDWEEEEQVEALESKISYEAAEVGKYDGDRLERFRLGELGKQKDNKMNPIKQLGVLKPCIELDIGRQIIGKIIAETTIEDRSDKSGDPQSMSSLDISKQLWFQSSPETEGANGRTESGLKRLFLSAIDCGALDKWGYANREQVRKDIEAECAKLSGTALIDYRRRYAINIDDAFTPTAETSCFDQYTLRERTRQIDNGLDWLNRKEIEGIPYKNPCVRGFLEWQVKDDSVTWIPSEQGNMVIEQHPPSERRNSYVIKGDRKAPANPHLYTMGVDPVDQGSDAVSTYRSKAAAVVKRRRDIMVDGEHPEVGEMKTNRFIASYLHRPDDPEEFYEDMIKMGFYFGCRVFGERNRGVNCINYFKKRGYSMYLEYPPIDVATSKSARDREWASSSSAIISQYVGKLQAYVFQYGMALNNIDLIRDLSMFSYGTQTKHDLTVAMGFAELADTELAIVREPDKKTGIIMKRHVLR